MFERYKSRLDYFWQWDSNQQLIVDDDTIFEVHFSNRSDTTALVCEIKEVDGIRVVDVPNILLQKAWYLHVYAFAENRTKYEKTFEVKGRDKPADYVYTETEVKSFEELEKKVDSHIADTSNPHKVTAEQVGAYSKAETDTKLAGKLDKVKSLVRVYPGVYATDDTDGTPHLITATSDLSYIGAGSGYIPLYADGGQLKTAEPTEDDAAANKAYVDAVKADFADKLEASNKAYELIETITLTEATNTIARSREPDGTAYNFSAVALIINVPETTDKDDGNVRVDLYYNEVHYIALVYGIAGIGKTKKRTIVIWKKLSDCLYIYGGGIENTQNQVAPSRGFNLQDKMYEGEPYTGQTCVKIRVWPQARGSFDPEVLPAGTNIKIYGVRA